MDGAVNIRGLSVGPAGKGNASWFIYVRATHINMLKLLQQYSYA